MVGTVASIIWTLGNYLKKEVVKEILGKITSAL